jgi:hypothetical protein
MKRIHSPLILIFAILLAASLACNFAFSLGGTPTDTPTPTEVPTSTATPLPPPTNPPPPTEAPPVVVPDTPVPETEVGPSGGVLNPNASNPGDVYYNETFNDLNNWSTFVLKGEESGLNYEISDNRLRTTINNQDTYFYYIFEGGSFSDIRMDIEVENRASNTNFVGMICRYSDNGWYETNILNTGEYVVYYSDGANFSELYSGGSTLIHTGQKINDYAMTCQGDQLTIYINGSEVKSIPLRTGDFRFLPDGQVGLSVSTTFAIPVVVDFLKYILSVP